MIWFAYTEGKEPDEISRFKERIFEVDLARSPMDLIRIQYTPLIKSAENKLKTTNVPQTPKKPRYTPSWWRGDTVNYSIAKQVMGALPK